VVLVACSKAAAPIPTAAPDPGVVFTYPANAQLDVPTGARIVVTFSDPVVAGVIAPCTSDALGVVGAACLVGPEGPVAVTPEVVGDGRTVELTGAALAPGTTYAVYMRPALVPAATHLPASEPLLRFTTRATRTRAAPPELIAVNGGPPGAPQAFRPMYETSTIRLVFSEPLDPRTVMLAPGAIELVDAGSGMAVPATLLAKGIHVSIDPIADLAVGRAYAVKLGASVLDLGGQPIAPTTIMLIPQDSGASRPIREMLRTRQDGDPGAMISRAGAAANMISIDKPLIGVATSKVMAGAMVAELGDPSLGGPIAFTLRRGQRLRATGLDIKLGGELPSGLSTGDIVIELASDAGGRIYRNPHQPADQIPDNDRAPLAVDLSLDLAMYAVDPTGNAALTQTVLGVQATGTAVATDGVLDLEAVVALDLDLLGVTQAPTNLVLELISDPAAKLAVDDEPPRLLAALPGATAGELAVDAGIELVFSEPIDLDRARDGGLSLQTSGGDPVPSVIESHGAAVVIRPVASLAYSASYRVVLANVMDLAQHRLEGADPVTFTTPALIATTAPLTVAAVHPGVPCALIGGDADSPGRCSSGATGDDRYRPFTLAANEPIDVRFTQPPAPDRIALGAACGTGSVRVEEVDAAGACVAPVAGSLIHHDRALSFVPDVPWQVGAHYRLSLVSGDNAACDPGEICGPGAVNAASFDPLAGNVQSKAGGPDLVIDATGAPATDATLVITQAAPYSDINGSGAVDAGEQARDANRVALQITGTSGSVTSASFTAPDCLPDTAVQDGCMYLSGVMPVELLPLAHGCALPDGQIAASCVPVALSPQSMYATSISIDATAMSDGDSANIKANTRTLVMRIREPAAGGPVTGYLIAGDAGSPVLVVALDVYLDAPDMTLLGLNHDLHSKPLSIALRGPLRFLPDGRIAIAVANTSEIPLAINIGNDQVSGSVNMVMPAGGLKLQLVSPPLRGGLP
jgi:hypothetical protein